MHKFRYDIVFIRTLSFIIVVLYHFKVPGFSIGLIGVDVFVISGYLITAAFYFILFPTDHNRGIEAAISFVI